MTRLPAIALLLLAIPWGCAWAFPFGEIPTERISARGITVRYSSGFDDLAGRILRKAESFLDESSAFLGLETAAGYTIVVARNREEFTALQPASGRAPEWAGALAYPVSRTVLILSPGALNAREAVYWSILRHEMVHLVLGGAQAEAGMRFPTWFEEGIATFMSGEMNLSRLLHLGWAQVTGNTPEFENLRDRFPSEPGLAEAAYARSFLFIRYLTRRFGDGAVAGLVKSSLSTGSLEGGAMAALGTPLETIMQGFRQYSRVKATWIPVIASSASIWGMITLLFLLTWYRKRVLGLRTLDRWEEEERLPGDGMTSGGSDEDRHTLH